MLNYNLTFLGNYPLCRVLPNIYEVSPDPFPGHVMALVSLLPQCDNQEKLALLNLFSLIAKDNPSVSDPPPPTRNRVLNNRFSCWRPACRSCASTSATRWPRRRPCKSSCTWPRKSRPSWPTTWAPWRRRPRSIPTPCAWPPRWSGPSGSWVRQVGWCGEGCGVGGNWEFLQDRAQDALNFVLEYLPKADKGSQSTLLREATLLCSSYPVLFTDKVLVGVRQRNHARYINTVVQF